MTAKRIVNPDEPYQQILSRLAHIEHKVESIDETNAFALRATAAAHQKSIDAIFGRSKRRAQVYLAADGTRSVGEIAAHLRMRQPNVTIELNVLKEEGLLELNNAPGRKDFYAKKPIDKTIQISKHIRKKYNLRANGKTERGNKKK